jgi:hypothetical protein
MPKQYEDIRDSYVARGKPLKEAKRLAAMTYNAHRKPGVAPVTGKLGDMMTHGMRGAKR